MTEKSFSVADVKEGVKVRYWASFHFQVKQSILKSKPVINLLSYFLLLVCIKQSFGVAWRFRKEGHSFLGHFVSHLEYLNKFIREKDCLKKYGW